MQTLAGSTRDFVPFAGRALCLTRLLGKGKPLCFLLLPLHCGFLSRERQVCPQAVVADARCSRTTHHDRQSFPCKTHLFFSFFQTHQCLVMTRKTQCCGSLPCGSTVDRHSSANSGARYARGQRDNARRGVHRASLFRIVVECIATVLSCRRRQSLLCTWSTSRQCLPCLWRQFQPRARRQRQCWMHRDGTRQVCDACSSRVRTCLPWLSCVSSAIATTSVVSEVTAPAVHAAPASVASHCASACRD